MRIAYLVEMKHPGFFRHKARCYLKTTISSQAEALTS
jgi:hypothetical protein